MRRPASLWIAALALAIACDDGPVPDQAPRTRHVREDGAPRFTNRLVSESSPYLLQHAHNPVDWYPWGEEAFERARREKRPIFLSIGYSTCHWCHVMEEESFEDEEIAAFLNEHFVCVKVDREERPDVDDVYMTAVQALTGGGGWPLTVVLTPELEPFFGGTYFPPRDGDRGARRGLLSILREIERVYREKPAFVVEEAAKLSAAVREASAPLVPAGVPGPEAVARGAERLLGAYDAEWGGFGSAPKFPRPSTFELLLRRARRSGNSEARDAAAHSLRRIAAGGIRDAVGGGFHRYATDRRWAIPHFEKMLYDNAALASVYLDAWRATGDALFAEVASETLDYLVREMRSDQGTFFSATDADSEGPGGRREEGLFFTWTEEEIRAAVGEGNAEFALDAFGASEPIAFEGRLILHRDPSTRALEKKYDLGQAEVRSRIEAVARLLYDARSRRPPPLRDEKIVTAWNALTISAFARGALALGRDDWRAVAERAASFFAARVASSTGLRRTYTGADEGVPAFLDDHAALVAAFLDVFEATGRARWLEAAIALQQRQDATFYDEENGGYWASGEGHERLLARSKPAYDGPEPSGNSLAAQNLLELAELTSRQDYRRRAEATLAAFGSALAAGSAGLPRMLTALDFALASVKQIVIVAGSDPGGAATLAGVVGRTYVPASVLVRVVEEEDAESLARLVPLVEDKTAMGGHATAYVCVRSTCKRPTTDAGELARQLVEDGAAIRRE